MTLFPLFRGKTPGKKAKRQSISTWKRQAPRFEVLEDRRLLSGGVVEFPTPMNDPSGSIVAGPDHNLWFVQGGGSRIYQMTPDGVITNVFTTIENGDLHCICDGPDGNLWFTEGASNKIGRITPAGVISEFPAPGFTQFITAGPDNQLWFTGDTDEYIGRIDVNGQVTRTWSVHTFGARPVGITSGPDGNVWFTEQFGDKIGLITPNGDITEVANLPPGSHPTSITGGPDGSLWFTEAEEFNPDTKGKIGRITVDGVLTEYPVLTSHSVPSLITAGPDGNLWFTTYNAPQVGRITPNGTVTEFSIPSSTSTTTGLTVGPDSNIWFTELGAANKVGKLYLLSATGTTLTETAGQRFADVVASFHDDQPGMVATNNTAVINWGDSSQVSTGGVSDNGDGTWDIAASHTYTSAGAFAVTITITDLTDLRMTTTATSSVQVNSPGGGGGGGGEAPSVALGGQSADPHAGRTFPLPGARPFIPVARAEDNGFSHLGVASLAVRADYVNDANGDPLTSNNVTSFNRLFGDTQGHRTVNADDVAVMFATFGKHAGEDGYVSYLDYNGDGAIDDIDLYAFIARYGTTLDP
jgi:streptogramin lyase